ncbi:MAG: GNAT family N-acetyltransferase [Burkholderiales bacterium]|nr:GNAT family N-acetyltransferase [Burkholderiales bacterium]
MKRKTAEEIAALLNARNQLTKKYDGDAVMKDSGNYVYRILEGHVIGCVEVKLVQWYQAELLHLTVDPDFEGKGYARQLLASALDRAKAQRARVAQCTIRQDNDRSAKLFGDFGFTQVGRFRNEISGNNVIVWQKILTPAP